MRGRSIVPFTGNSDGWKAAMNCTVRKIIGALVLALCMAFTTVPTAAPAEAARIPPTVAVCDKATGGRVAWNNKNPAWCPGQYTLYDMTMWSRPRVILQVGRVTTYTWRSLVRDLNAAQRWCNRNSLTCELITGLGLLLVAPLVAPARS